MSTQTQRERFEAAFPKSNAKRWRKETGYTGATLQGRWEGWIAAETAAIERCAKVCDEHLYAEKAAEAIRALLPKEE